MKTKPLNKDEKRGFQRGIRKLLSIDPQWTAQEERLFVAARNQVAGKKRNK